MEAGVSYVAILVMSLDCSYFCPLDISCAENGMLITLLFFFFFCFLVSFNAFLTMLNLLNILFLY